MFQILNKFMNFYLLLLNLASVIHSLSELKKQFKNQACYESLSYPTQFIEFFSNFPTNPPLIYIDFGIKVYSYELNWQMIDLHENYHFKLINGPCRSSIKFSTNGLFFSKMRLVIIIGILNINTMISTIDYTFYNQFNPDFYLLIEKYSHLAILVQVRYHDIAHIQRKETLLPINWSYLTNMTYGYTDICVLTYNNAAVVLRPDNYHIQHNHFIIGLSGKYVKDGIVHGKYYSAAFSCQSDEFFEPDLVIFIDEHSKQVDLFLELIYIIFNQFHTNISRTYINITNMNRINVNNSRNVPSRFKKVFFIIPHFQSKRLLNGYIRTYFRADNGFIYDIREFKMTNMSVNVFRQQYTSSRSITSFG